MTYPNPKPWRFLNTSFGNAFFNMAVDEHLVRSVALDESLPVIRIFGWTPAAVSFGYAQRIGREIDAVKAKNAGIDIVRRPTGGRAVLHWNELTYSVICPSGHDQLGGNISEVYQAISSCLVTGLQSLGVEASLERGRPPVPSPRGENLTSPCFSSTSQFEITLQGKKLVGSAQRRIGGIVLQHGSLLMGSEHKQVVDLMPDNHARLRKTYRQQLEESTICLEEAGYELNFNEIASGLREGFARSLDTELLEEPLTESEVSGVHALIDAKYGTQDWNLGDRSAEVTRRLIV